MWEAVLITIIIVIVSVLLLTYLHGGFSYTDTVDSERSYKRTRCNDFGFNESVDYVKKIVIKRHYGNGRIKYITRTVKI